MSPRFVLGRENVPCVAEVVTGRSKLIVETIIIICHYSVCEIYGLSKAGRST